MRNDIRQMTSQWSKLTTSPLLERRPLSPSAAHRHVTFQASNSASPETLFYRPQALAALGAVVALDCIIHFSETMACQLNA